MFSLLTIFWAIAGIIGFIVCLIGMISSKKSKKSWKTGLIIFVLLSVFGISAFTFIAPKDYISGKEFDPAPAEIYTTPAEENGFGDKDMFVDGTVGEMKEHDHMKTCEIITDTGAIAMIKVPVITSSGEWKKLKKGTSVRVYFQYLGYSDVLDEASGILLKVS